MRETTSRSGAGAGPQWPVAALCLVGSARATGGERRTEGSTTRVYLPRGSSFVGTATTPILVVWQGACLLGRWFKSELLNARAHTSGFSGVGSIEKPVLLDPLPGPSSSKTMTAPTLSPYERWLSTFRWVTVSNWLDPSFVREHTAKRPTTLVMTEVWGGCGRPRSSLHGSSRGSPFVGTAATPALTRAPRPPWAERPIQSSSGGSLSVGTAMIPASWAKDVPVHLRVWGSRLLAGISSGLLCVGTTTVSALRCTGSVLCSKLRFFLSFLAPPGGRRSWGRRRPPPHQSQLLRTRLLGAFWLLPGVVVRGDGGDPRPS